MENIGSGTDTAQHHSNYNCDLGLVSAHQHRHQQQVINHQLSLQDREKNFSVTHLLDLPGHLYHDTQSGDVSRVNNGAVEHHQRINQSIKAHEGRKEVYLQRTDFRSSSNFINNNELSSLITDLLH